MAELLKYKGFPVVRDGNRIYFGEPHNSVMVVMTVLENMTIADTEVPSRIIVQLQSTDPDLALKKEKILNECERKTLSDALNIGSVWLEKNLGKRTQD